MWITQYHRTVTDGRKEVSWREDKDLPPSTDRICSPDDTDARYATKRGCGWEGYKLHLSQTCDDATVTGLTAPPHPRRYHRRDCHRWGEATSRSTLLSTAAICLLMSTS